METFESRLTNPIETATIDESQLIPRRLLNSCCLNSMCGCEYGMPSQCCVQTTLSPYIYLYNYEKETLEENENVKFDQPPIPIELPNGIHFLNRDTVVICCPGLYCLSYFLLPQGSNHTFALFLNGKEIPGSRYTQQLSAKPISATVLIPLPRGQNALQIKNVGSTPVTIVDGNLPETVNASVSIFKIH